MTEHTKTVVNIVAIGNSNIGKTSLLIREASNIYADIPAVMIGIDFKTKQYQVGGMNVKSHLWDICTGGEGEIRHRKTPLYRGKFSES
jgi:GTPase SAR1 family protein